MADARPTPSFVGPHEGRELELMLSGSKPMSMFFQPFESEFEYFPEAEFDEFVSQGRFVKYISVESIRTPNNQEEGLRRILYALPNEAWRIKAFLFIQALYDSLLPGWRPDLDRAIGLLLGYDRDDIENFLTWMSEKNSLRS